MTDTEQTTQKRTGRPRTRMKPVPEGVKYPNQGPKKRRKGISILIQVNLRHRDAAGCARELRGHHENRRARKAD